MMVMLRTQAAIKLWLTGFAGAAVLQGRFPRFIATRSDWNYAPGWQREIAIWNVGMLTAILLVRRPRTDVDRSLLTAFLVLATLLAQNHVSALRSSRGLTHWLGAGANAAGVTSRSKPLDRSDSPRRRYAERHG